MVPIERLMMPRVNELLRFIRSRKRRTLIPWTRDPFGRARSQEKSKFSEFRCWPKRDLSECPLLRRLPGEKRKTSARREPFRF